MAKLLYQGHGSYRIVTSGQTVIYIDPFAGEGYDLPADLILVTHQHSDHNQTSLPAKKPDCRIITEGDALKGGHYNTFQTTGVTVEAVEAYNKNHRKDACVGYIITVDGVTVYASGDTSATEQMKTFAARKLDYALLPCDGIYNMDLAEASACADLIGARHSIPIHLKPGALFDLGRAEGFTGKNRLIVRPGEEINL